MVIRQQHQTKTELAVNLLRERIRLGELSPGERLHLQSLQEELGMSPTPIREALRLLQADGVVTYTPHLGIVVTRTSPVDAAEIYFLRGVLEPLAVIAAVERMTPELLRRLSDLQNELEVAAAAGDGSGVSTANAAWHWAIYESAESKQLAEFIRQLWDRFPWRTMWAIPERSVRSVKEHARIMSAIENGDSERAGTLMRAHVIGGKKTVLGDLEREA